MKIENKTHWRSDQILALARKVAEAELDPEKRIGFLVFARYRRRGSRTAGLAVYGGRRITLCLDREAVDPVKLAAVIAHEMAHCRGMRHRQMRGSTRYTWAAGWREVWAWAASYPIARRPIPVVATATTRREHCLAMIAQWQRRQRLASTKLQTWTRRLQATERAERLAAAKAEAEAAHLSPTTETPHEDDRHLALVPAPPAATASGTNPAPATELP